VILQHIVLFSFPRDLTSEEAAEMRDMVASWPTRIGLMTRCRLGTDLTGARNRGYAYLLYTEFPDVESMNAYRAHPVHLEFLAWLTERSCTPLAFDYLLDDQTVLMSEPAQTASTDEAVSPAGIATGKPASQPC
jgi:Stress responsive A/B Barrel Domain